MLFSPINRAARGILLAVSLLILVLGARADEPASGTKAPTAFLNIQDILERAKQKVFPALVFVKPIVEDLAAGEKRKLQVFGSGVIISPDGIVLTNNHVVDKAIKVYCVLSDKTQVSADIVGCDPDTDLALLKLSVPEERLPLPFATFADSDAVTEGDFVMALGSPFGFTRSISLGIISNMQRYLGFETEYRYNTWIQTDAAINPGNSGGPLVNTDGQIVGINTLGIFLADNVGFSIPSNVARHIAEELLENGEVQRAWSGMKFQALKDFFTSTFTDSDSGVLVADVEANSPAERAGVRRGDILLRLGGEPITGTYVEELPRIERTLAQLPTGTPLPLKVARENRRIDLEITLVLKGKVEGDTFDCRRWNMTVKEINRHEEPSLHFYRPQGVFVHGVRYPGNARESGLRRRDIITSVDSEPIETLEDVKTLYERRVADESLEKEVLIEVIRSGYKKWINLDYRKDYDKRN